ncbi:MAG: YIP1 family protein [Pseudomonadota bacterium]|nr:YIP1 family protein [Pseudomonadota bacterium]
MINRIQAILLQPKQTWPIIATESATIPQLFIPYLLVLAAIPAICGFIGMSLIGVSVFGVGVKTPILAGLAGMLVSYVLSLVGIFVLSLIINALAPTFGGKKDPIQAAKVAVYGSTAALLGGVFSLIPMLSVLGLVAAIYSIYLIYLGLPVLMNNPPEKSAAYTAVVIVAAIVLGLVIGLVSSMFMPKPAVTTQNGWGQERGGISIETPDGKITFDPTQLEAAAKQLEATYGQMANTQPSADAAATDSDSADQAVTTATITAVAAVSTEALRAALPEQLAGFARQSIQAERNQAMGMSVSEAKASYQQGEQSVTIKVTDLGSASMFAQMMGGMLQAEKETETRVERTFQQDGRSITEEYQKDGSSAVYRTILKNGIVVELNGNPASIEQLKQMAGQVNLNQLEQLQRPDAATS